MIKYVYLCRLIASLRERGGMQIQKQNSEIQLIICLIIF